MSDDTRDTGTPIDGTDDHGADEAHDERLAAIAGTTSGRTWRVVAVLQFVLIVVVGGGAALLAVLEVGPFAPGDAGRASAPDELWICPMHPEVRQDHPGSCPICGMSLVRQETAAPAGAGEDARALPGMAPVTVPTTVLQHGSVRRARASRVRMGDEVLTVGRVEADETRLRHVHSRVSGWITSLSVDETGQFVVREDELMQIFSRDVLQAEQELLMLGGRGRGGAGSIGDPIVSLADAARQRLLVFGVPPDVIDEVARSGRARATVPIRSPVTGHVLARDVAEGTYVEPGMDMFTIAHLDRVWVWADLYERDVASVHLGDRAEIRTLALGDRLFPGEVTFFDPTVGETTRTLRVRIEIANPDLALRPGMWAAVRITGNASEVLAVPYDAVVDTGLETYVFAETAPGTFAARRVAVGRSSGGLTEIRGGLEPGDVVVASGTFLIDSESRIRGGGTGGSAHAGHAGSGAGPAPAAAPPEGGAHAAHGGT